MKPPNHGMRVRLHTGHRRPWEGWLVLDAFGSSPLFRGLAVKIDAPGHPNHGHPYYVSNTDRIEVLR